MGPGPGSPRHLEKDRGEPHRGAEQQREADEVRVERHPRPQDPRLQRDRGDERGREDGAAEDDRDEVGEPERARRDGSAS